MKKEARFHLNTQDLRAALDNWDIEGRHGTADVDAVFKYLSDLNCTELAASDIDVLASLMEEKLIYTGGTRVYRPEAEYLLLNVASRTYLANARKKR